MSSEEPKGDGEPDPMQSVMVHWVKSTGRQGHLRLVGVCGSSEWSTKCGRCLHGPEQGTGLQAAVDMQESMLFLQVATGLEG